MTWTLSERVTYANRQFQIPSGSKLTIYHLRKRYRSLGIKLKVTKANNVSINKYTPKQTAEQIALAQQQLFIYDQKGYVVYQLDESIFDARQQITHSWSSKNHHTLIPKTPNKFNKQVCVMAAISSSTKKLFYETKPRHFNSDDTIAFLSRLLQLHRRKKLCIFFDNSSIHVGKKTTAFINS